MNINLPDLLDYRNMFLAKGVAYPLQKVKTPATGLLSSLPAAPAEKTGWPWTEQTDPEIYSGKRHWPKFTIVTPSYNQGQFIEQTIRAVLLQNYPNLEYVIIDGGSTDETRAILEKYAPWISYWKSEKDNGQSQAINQGFSLACGDYLAWINSDDFYLKDIFFKVATCFINSDTSFIYGYVLNFNVSRNSYEKKKVPPLLDYFLRLPSLAQPSCFWSAQIHQPLWEELHCSLDFELWQRLVKGNKRKLIKEPLSVANIHADAKTSDRKMDSKWANDHKLICSENAHGPVDNWRTITLLNRAWITLHQWLG